MSFTLNDPIKLKNLINISEYKKLPNDLQMQYWKIRKDKFLLISDIAEKNPEHLQNAFCYAQKKQLDYHNKCNLFTEFIEVMESIAETKNIKLNDLETDFHKNNRKYKKKYSVQKISTVQNIEKCSEIITPTE